MKRDGKMKGRKEEKVIFCRGSEGKRFRHNPDRYRASMSECRMKVDHSFPQKDISSSYRSLHPSLFDAAQILLKYSAGSTFYSSFVQVVVAVKESLIRHSIRSLILFSLVNFSPAFQASFRGSTTVHTFIR